MSSSLQGNYGAYDMGMTQAWNPSGYVHNNHLAALGATTRMKPSARGRSALPTVFIFATQIAARVC